MMEVEHGTAFADQCDACGASGISLMKVSLGRDFFGRSYDRLSPNADLSPKWYCDPCSVEKNLQRDFRDIKGEFAKLNSGDESVLTQADQLQRATLRLQEISALITGATLKQTLLKPNEVSALAHSLEARRTASLA